MNKPTILAFAASTSSQSINKQLAEYAANALPEVQVRVIDLNDFTAPMYSVDAEAKDGIPASAKAFVAEIEAADGIILSLAEHNGSYTAAFKSLFDWGTRHKHKIWSEKPMLLLSTSPGARGGATVLGTASSSFPHLGAKIAATFSLPSFSDNFSSADGIQDETLKKNFARKLAEFRSTF
ncbi:NAD(P)H-dependent oxidoreductase [Coraliomargarita sp. SDUM461003]|uniref:NAD(P)H-dependent oxidoreductase n=1 Tax=Thalassobacterium maritimum TaxID=3041265 RepID=A0ABU1AXF7_9BACT|nr:NAD(P)H-dependent oxidoreductase [Coraliomargarita sp. SDUM461003]MDQ8208277.1 NAD(P)H-dependent oxidoreductase [Coraliomargarita sp. SDUM461003]